MDHESNDKQQDPAVESQEMSTEPVAQVDDEEQAEEIDWYNWKDDEEGFNMNWAGVGLIILMVLNMSTNDTPGYWISYACLAIAVLIHELGHAVAGLLCKCHIKSVQLFFVSAISYRHSAYEGGRASLKNIRWTLGALPFGGLTTFSTDDGGLQSVSHGKQLFIASAGVLCNFVLFAVLYFIADNVPMSTEWTWYMVCAARLSLFLGVINLIPIFPLDGGNIVLQLYGLLGGKMPSPKTLGIMYKIGSIIVIVLFFAGSRFFDAIASFLFSNF